MDLTKVEYRVREVKRYIVTRYHQQETEGGRTGCADSRVVGEYDNAETAYDVGYAMCRNEHLNLGWPCDDERIQYPRHPDQITEQRDTPFVPAEKVTRAVGG